MEDRRDRDYCAAPIDCLIMLVPFTQHFVCIQALRCYTVPMMALHGYLADHVVRTSLRFLVDSPYVLADDSQEEQIYARKECNGQDQCGKTLGRMQPKLNVQRINRVQD